MKHRFVHLPLAIAGIAFSVSATAALEPVTRTYADIAHAAYEDSLISARALRETIRAFLDTADSGAMAYDQMLGESNPEGNAIVQEAVDALKAQTRVMERAAVALGVESLEIEGSEAWTTRARSSSSLIRVTNVVRDGRIEESSLRMDEGRSRRALYSHRPKTEDDIHE